MTATSAPRMSWKDMEAGRSQSCPPYSAMLSEPGSPRRISLTHLLTLEPSMAPHCQWGRVHVLHPHSAGAAQSAGPPNAHTTPFQLRGAAQPLQPPCASA